MTSSDCEGLTFIHYKAAIEEPTITKFDTSIISIVAAVAVATTS